MSSTAEPEPAPVRVHKSAIYVVVRAIIAVLYRVFLRRRVIDLQNLPAEGGVMIVANHQSFLDIPLIAVATQRHVAFVARDSLARSKLLAFVMRSCGAVLIRRGASDRAAMREMLEHLQLGDCLAIFPEGTRTPDGRVQEFRGGALLAARRARVPVVPTAIRGTFEAWPKGASLPRAKRVSVQFAPPIDPAAPEALERLHATISELVGDGRFEHERLET